MRNTIYLLYVVSMLCITTTAIAQINTDLRPQVKSPEVNKFEQYMNMPVNLVSGTPQVSIPIYTLEYGGMTLPISLEYDASGVKVESIASSVGQNWSLNVGGVVSRNAKGAPDEGSVGYPKSSIMVNGYYKDYGLTNLEKELDRYTNVENSRFMQFNWWLEDVNAGKKDAQPDLFYFSTPEGGSKFVFNDQRKVVYLENTDFMIQEDYVPNYFRTWLVTSPKGTKYKFGLDTGTNFGANNAIEKNYTNQSINEITFDNNYIVNSWFLTEISNFTSSSKIQLEYVDNNYTHTIISKPVSQSTFMCLPNSTMMSPNCNITPESQYATLAENSLSTTSQSHVISKLISKIKAGTTQINFIYSNRDDLTPESGVTPKRLDEVQITVVNPVTQVAEIIKKIKFSYTTQQSAITTGSKDATDIKRLQLTGITEMSANEQLTKPYTFVYNTTSLPSKLSFAQDKWGYYNGKTQNPSLFPPAGITLNTSLYADRKVDLNFAKAGALEQIIYPTKGSVNFQYESHKSDVAVDLFYDVNNTSPLVGTIASTQSIDGIKSTLFTYVANDAESLLLTANLYYNPTGTAGCSPTSAVRAASIVDMVTNTEIATIFYAGVTTSKTIALPIDKKLLIDGRQYKLIAQGYGGTNGVNNMCNICYAKIDRVPIVPIYDIGGLRIKKIVHKEDDGSVIKETNYTYSQPKIVSNPKLFYPTQWDVNGDAYLPNFFSVVPKSAIVFNQALVNNAKSIGWDKGLYYTFSTGFDPLEINFMGPTISYAEVDQTDGNGVSKHFFNRYKGYFELNSFSSDYGIPPLPKSQSLLAGEKQSVLTLNTTGQTVQQSTYDYNYSGSDTTVKGIVPSVYSGAGGLVILYNVYTLQGQTKTLKTETQTTRVNNQDVTVTKDYEYTGLNHFQPTKTTTTNSLGEQLISKMYYPNDLQNEPLMLELITQNRKANPVRTENYNGTTKLSEQKMSYAKDASTTNLVVPKSTYGAKFPNSFPTIANIGNLEKKLTYDSYDSSGNLTQYTPEGGTSVTLLWGYNKTQPIAKIENATTAQVMSALGVSDLNAVTESNLTAINALRQGLPNAMVTTYTHIPLVGVSSITDPKGQTVYYNYDGLGRVQNVKDAQGNILGENQYHYKNQSNQSLF
jgi:YD repeat-containing protein